MSVYQVSLIATALGQEFRNVFHYRTPNPGILEGTAGDLATFFASSKILPISNRVSTSWVPNSLDVFDLFFPTNIQTISVSSPGAQAGENMGPRVAVALRTNRASRVIRRGQKRFGPISEAAQLSGVLSPTEIVAWDAVGVTLATVILGASSQYTPVVVKRIFVAGLKPHYRLPNAIGEYQAFDILTWTVNERISTQNTRRLPFL